jgi:NAD(P)-dependent dehydrogenase (short-subunit alcohol dehydrogenase family)
LEENNTIVAGISRGSSPSELTKLADAHPGSLSIHQCDMFVVLLILMAFENFNNFSANESHLSATISSILENRKRLDGLVLNAAVLEPQGRISDATIGLDSWKTHFDINFFSLISAIRSTIPALRLSKGKIIFVSSSSAVGNITAWGPYNASKAAMNSLCRCFSTCVTFIRLAKFQDRTLASEEPDITCVAIHPGMVHTDVS